jgi:signal transduction histidine kinase/ActR/RegA family two-component response regulator
VRAASRFTPSAVSSSPKPPPPPTDAAWPTCPHCASAAALLDAVLAGAPIGFAFLDTALRYVRLNPALAAINGMPLDAHLGRRPVDVLPELGPSIEASARRALELGAPVLDIRLELGEGDGRDGGAATDRQCSYYPVRTASGEVLGVGAIVSDVSRVRVLEAQLRQAQKLEAVGRLAGGIAHDFNNLLTVILANAQLVADALGDADAAARALRDDVAEIRRAARSAAALTRQLLAFGRRQALAPRTLDLNVAAASAEHLLRRTIGSDVVIALDLAPSPCVVRADPTQVEQVLVNLAINARDAMPNGGTLTIGTDECAVGGDAAARPCESLGAPPQLPDGRYAVLWVRDTGHGMDAATLARAFEPFFTTKEHGRGTGLGLATVYGIVTQSGGGVHITSAPGRGTTVAVFLPIVSRTDAAVDVADAADAAERDDVHVAAAWPRGTETVLLVEDERAVRWSVRRALERLGYRVIEAKHGADALLRWRDHADDIDLVLSDVLMPEMSGRTLVERLRAERPCLPALLLSGYTRDALQPNGPDDVVGDVALLQKPFSLGDLAHAVRDALDGACERV